MKEEPTASELREMAEKLLKKADELEKEKQLEKEKEVWPKKGDKYWVVNINGDIIPCVWFDEEACRNRIIQGIFPTEESAKMKALRNESQEVLNRVYGKTVSGFVYRWCFDTKQPSIYHHSCVSSFPSFIFLETEEETREWGKKYDEAWLYLFKNNKS